MLDPGERQAPQLRLSQPHAVALWSPGVCQAACHLCLSPSPLPLPSCRLKASPLKVEYVALPKGERELLDTLWPLYKKTGEKNGFCVLGEKVRSVGGRAQRAGRWRPCCWHTPCVFARAL